MRLTMLNVNNLIGFNGGSAQRNFYTDSPITTGLKFYFDGSNPLSYISGSSVAYGAGENGVVPIQLTNITGTTTAGGGIVFNNGSYGNTILNASSLPFTANGFTLSIWFKHTGTVSTARVQRYITMASGVEGPVLRHNVTSAASAHGYTFDSAGTYRSVDVASQILTGTYYNLVLRYNGSTLRLSKNNVVIGTLTATFTLSPLTGPIELGATGTEYFQGEMYIIQYFNEVLPNADLTILYDAYRGRFGL